MLKKPYQPQTSIRSSKQTIKSLTKKPTTNNPIPLNHQPISNTKKRTNSSFIQNSNKKNLQEARYSHKKYNSNSSFKNNKHKIFEVEHMVPMGFKSIKGQIQPRVYSVVTTTKNNEQKSITKKKIKRNFRNNEMLGEIGSCKKVIVEKAKSSCQGKIKTKGLVDESLIRKQDNVKTDLDEYKAGKQYYLRPQRINEENNDPRYKNNPSNKENYKKSHKNQQNQDLSRLANIDVQQLKKLTKLTSEQLSQLQSRSQTIDLLKFTIKTKLQKDPLSQSPYKLNSLLTSHQKAPTHQYIEQIMRLKELETNFYVEKITVLQNELNRYRKEAERQEKEGKVKWQEETRKVLVEKSRLEEENTLLKRENQALRTIIMKKLKTNNNNKCINSEHLQQNLINSQKATGYLSEDQ